ncbi:hypothetical protein HYPSUDRAFT_48502 [Hypholoma sublateritium FD-334 SS-4]|uniref:N-acetyltransferase domain-containing protein n=1 Tax=Hypholoma sublateritium (strain FD-334 SS-4) TaxID=945553 RepID=A0A0D2P468_HYPSF|nr:hypothetical protein HYPSUDRAFT_48502 [Hypholoma sublateritium FD-334 SS-4]
MASPASLISIYRIPSPAPLEDVIKYSQIRLSTLKTNPEAFSSTFEEAAQYTQHQWSERVNTDGRTTLAATRDVDKEWLGTLSLLHPRMLRPMTDVFPRIPRVGDAIAQGKIDRYLLVGMWVRPSARKTGVGQRLIKAALDIIKDEAGAPIKMVFLKVHMGNTVAQGLYSKLGFVEETDYEGAGKGHTTCMTISL